MEEIIALLHGIDQTVLDKTTRRRLTIVILGMLALTGRMTMRGISRWTEKGGSYRTIQRLFTTKIEWSRLLVMCVGLWFGDEEDEFLLAGDETVVTKAGKKTYGLDRFFSSIYRRPVKGIAFMAFSLISTKKETAYPVRMEQVVKEDGNNEGKQGQSKGKKKGKSGKKKQKKGGKPGRPKGSKNKNRRDVELPSHLQKTQGWLKSTLQLLGKAGINVSYFLFDGAYGNNHSLQMVLQCNLHLISKLRCDSALYFPFTGKQKKMGRRRKYGAKLKYDALPQSHRVSSETVDDIQTDTYQMQMWHKLFPDLLNIVIIVKTNLTNQKQARVVLFSSDLSLTADRLVHFYRLRFQIEFNFRAAKQFWGLEDFMNTQERPVYNFANLSMFMVSVSQKLIDRRRRKIGAFGIIDLKALFRGRKYALELLKLLPETPNDLLIDQFFAKITTLGGIHTTVDA